MTSRLQHIHQHLSGDITMSGELWQGVPLAPPDSIFKLTAAYNTDPYPSKVNLGVGAYRDNDGKPWILPVVKKATAKLLEDPSYNHEYLPITGLPEFTSAAAKLILGANSPAISEGRVVSVQTISGTGANHLAGLFLSRYYNFNGERQIFLSNPTWVNHYALFRNVGLTPVEYSYYDSRTIGLDLQGFKSTLESAPSRSVVLIHACAHNPTGVDPTREQWQELTEVMLAKQHYAFFDCAYQGFASGDLDNDAWAVRHFVEKKVPMLVCQSFAKNAGLYGERIGALHIISPDKDAADRVKSQLSVMQRSEISNPPLHGARLMALILNDAELFEEWKRDIKTMAHRIISMREALFHLLTNELKTPGNWDHITRQIGMFSFTGLNGTQVTGDGREGPCVHDDERTYFYGGAEHWTACGMSRRAWTRRFGEHCRVL
ncbi:putative aspartate aminotransferase, cytoplasmic [Chiua virens]|nr:putative aspartate aminotransferase, cytoplasmic [Chiua virens]